MRSRLLFAALVLPALLFVACGGGGSDEPTPTPSGPPLSDQEYVRGLCVGIAKWVDLAYSKSEDELRTAVGQFIDETKALNPPADARDFHAAFLKYLQDREETPAALLGEDPPLPSGDLRARLAAVERTLPECKSPLFARGEPSPTPGG